MDLAKAIKNLFNSDVPEKIIGMRHGEKIYETLATREELTRSEDMGEYFRIRPDSGDLNYTLYSKYFTEGDLEEEIIVLRNRRGRGKSDLAPLRAALARLPG